MNEQSKFRVDWEHPTSDETRADAPRGSRRSPKIRRWLIAALAVFAFWGSVVLVASNKAASKLGVVSGKLAELPETPNGVSSQTKDPSKRVAAIPWEGTPAQGLDRMVQVIDQMSRGRVVERTDDYLHAEFRSFLFRFVDDVEFLVNPRDHQIEIRSVSRLGYSDLGVNRKRVERLRERFLAFDSSGQNG